MSKTVLIMAGGTGGHVIPALAVAEVLAKRGYHIEWLGTERGIESRLVPDAGIPLNLIPVSGVRGKSLGAIVKAPFMIMNSVRQARTIIKRLNPCAVIGLGGFASGPGGIAAWLLGIPLIIHEQNATAGSTNKILAKFARRVLTGFPKVLGGDFVGNPVRESIASIPFEARSAAGQSTVAVLGGSLGALALNENIPEVIANLPEQLRPRIVHQSGRDKSQATIEKYRSLGVEAEVVEFVEDMAALYQEADVIVCRSGALTVSELACVAKPCLLVPFPHAIDDHQTANGQYLSDFGVAKIVQQRDWDTQAISQQLETWLLGESAELLERRKRLYEAATRDAAQQVADIVEEERITRNSQSASN